MLTRAGVAKRLGKCVATVRRMEGVELHPTKNHRGVNLFDPDEVEEVARSKPSPSPYRMQDLTARGIVEQDDRRELKARHNAQIEEYEEQLEDVHVELERTQQQVRRIQEEAERDRKIRQEEAERDRKVREDKEETQRRHEEALLRRRDEVAKGQLRDILESLDARQLRSLPRDDLEDLYEALIED